MAKTPCSLIALPVHWTVAQTIAWDDGDPHLSTLVPANTWTRTFLAPSTGGASEDAPIDLLAQCESVLGSASWTFRLTTSGKVRITYKDAGAGSMTLAGTALGNALGFTSNIVSIAQDAYQDGDTMPAFCWFPYTLDEDTDFQPEFALAMGAPLANGLETVWDEGTQRLSRSLRCRYAPATEAIRATKGLNATPFWPPMDAPTRRTRPSLVPESCPAGWTVHETVSLAPGRRLAYALYDLQELIAGTSSRYIVGGIPLESVRSAQNRARLSVSSFTSLVDVPRFDLTFTTTETR